jgi:hypothetical protein
MLITGVFGNPLCGNLNKSHINQSTLLATTIEAPNHARTSCRDSDMNVPCVVRGACRVEIFYSHFREDNTTEQLNLNHKERKKEKTRLTE